ncbi:uncharacterized protein PFL1_04043 [Pseudozyma flocculosa PF-1]|uniref:DNA replication complex GINS protein PSF2 n=2 Tax=Pseudozyma flocculosa TaxID=84751 RepID=A0A5C3ETH9_9BASI|nr:uncharacterized protein PFL1_04043 [Pseudozyma flocculosa PF-1]EPQ28216.1 hypothetical protein PFL1_04043 [Pseudozyma flocculosa PF-1]SPO35352.1 related to PSF2 - part of GINS, replication multiprotein complex [Pseudozyma flocculosa]
MALPPILHGGPLPSELDFYTTTSSTTSISIIPLLSIDRVRLLTAIYGPFKPPQPATVPLWLALYLRNKKKALVIPPDWLSVPALTETLRHETSQPGFAPLPFEWIGVSNAILRHASHDVRDAGKVRGLLKDIREARQSKVLAGVAMVNSVHLEMTGISMHEIAELRPFFTTAFQHLKSLQPPSAQQPAASASDQFDASFPMAAFESSPSDPYAFSQSPSQSQPARRHGDGDDNNYDEGGGSFSMSYSADPESSTSALHGTAWNDESMRSDFTFADRDQDHDASAAAGAAAMARFNASRGRPSNISDSGYATATRAPADKDAGQNRARASDTRPPRFNMDDDDDDGSQRPPDDESMDTY